MEAKNETQSLAAYNPIIFINTVSSHIDFWQPTGLACPPPLPIGPFCSSAPYGATCRTKTEASAGLTQPPFRWALLDPVEFQARSSFLGSIGGPGPEATHLDWTGQPGGLGQWVLHWAAQVVYPGGWSAFPWGHTLSWNLGAIGGTSFAIGGTRVVPSWHSTVQQENH